MVYMTKEQIQTYTLRVSQASGCELILILYDIILEDIEKVWDCTLHIPFSRLLAFALDSG